MRIVITDTGTIWNHENPFLEQFKDIVLVVCLYGKKVTDRYKCFVSPYKQVGMGIDKYGVEDQKLQALASAAGKLNLELNYHDDIIFLTDNVPSTLYPYYVIKDLNEFNHMHFVIMSPWRFEGNRRLSAYYQMLSDLAKLDSILYYDSNRVLDAIGQNATMTDAVQYARKYLGELMPGFMTGIYTMRDRPCFFDFASMTYVPLESGFDKIDLSKKDKIQKEIKFPVHQQLATLGIVYLFSYPQDTEYVKEEVERPAARLDGKKVCNVLREQRIRLAEANHIPFKSEECPSIGPCAGTCEKCDRESKYLRKQLQKIPEDQRVYPKFDPAEEVLS